MDVGSITSKQTPASGDTAAAKPQIDYNAFLQLLIAEMRNQDPTEPMKSSEYVAQFATFSTVEQAIQTNAKLDAILTSSSLAQADAALGHTVTSADGKISGVVESLRITSDGLLATLDTGDQLLLGEGVSIS
jgi:flagellar basal-body rod modification protein FlgD